MKQIIDRLKEVSTWQGIITVLTAAGVVMSPELRLAIVSTGLAVFGLVSIIMRERAGEPPMVTLDDRPAPVEPSPYHPDDANQGQTGTVMHDPNLKGE